MGFMKNYKDAVKFAGFKLPATLMLVLAFLFSVIAMAGTLFVLSDITLGVLISLLVLDLFIGLPFYLVDKRIRAIEENLPDVLRHMATTLKTGGTVESSLKEVIRVQYGPITAGLKTVINQINEGKTFEDAFMNFAQESRSEMLNKAAVIILAARKSGGGLVDTLSAMALDMREVYRLRKERENKTFLQFLFIIVAGSFISPFIFGILRTVIEILFTVSAQLEAAETGLLEQFDFLFKSYLILESSLTTLGAVQVKDGKISRGVLIIPVFAAIAYGIYFLTSYAFGSMVGIWKSFSYYCY